MADIADRNLQHQQAMEAQKDMQKESDMQKEHELQLRLEQARQEKISKAEERKREFTSKMNSVREEQKRQEQEREKAYGENVAKLNAAREQGQQLLKQKAESSRESREKHVEKFTANKIARRKEKREEITALKSKISTDFARSIEVREKFMEENVGKKSDFRDIFTEIVQQNKARLQRSDECAREQIIAKVQATKDKIDGLLTQRQQVLDYRNAAHKESMKGKTHIKRLKEIVNDASTKRINQVLKELDMPLLPTEASKEGEEGEQKQ
jgi:hypothetical protein